MSSGSLHDHQFAEARDPLGVAPEGRDVGDDVDDVVVLEPVVRGVGVGARTVHDDGADALVLPRGVEDQLEHFCFGTHGRAAFPQ